MLTETKYFVLTDIGTLGKYENYVPYIYERDKGWVEDDLLDEYVFLGNADRDIISAEKANELIEKFNRGESLLSPLLRR